MENMQGGVSEETSDPRPVLWSVGCAFDRRADMMWENRPCHDIEQVIGIVREAIARRATEIKVRDFTFTSEMARSE